MTLIRFLSYIIKAKPKTVNTAEVKAQNIQKVIFPEPYEQAPLRYSKDEFNSPIKGEQKPSKQPINNNSIFDTKSLLPMLLSGKFNDILKPVMSMFGISASGGSFGDIAKIFELFKPKSKAKKEEKKDEEDVSSKFDDMIIIED